MVNVLIVDDSSVSRELLGYILKSDKNIKIIGSVRNGKEATDFVRIKKPDVITMDINMPIMDGIEATKLIMQTTPVPIIIVSSHWDAKDVNDSFNALQIGAVAIADKPSGFDSPLFKEISQNLIRLVNLMAEIKVVKRLPVYRIGKINPSVKIPSAFDNRIEIVSIGASTGGPVIIEKILANIKEAFPLPVVIVQHIMPGFSEGFSEWLNQTAKIPVKLAEQGELLTNNICYIAPDFYHLSVSPEKKVILLDEPAVNGLRPSVSVLFSSVLKSFGKNSLSILLSGMGKDGAFELKLLRNEGGVTIAQDSESVIVNGMPGEAVKLGAASFIYRPEEIIMYLNNL
jgi:two-component system, chemotaxis family, protein-glutamate methylesterase/glutaminase